MADSNKKIVLPKAESSSQTTGSAKRTFAKAESTSSAPTTTNTTSTRTTSGVKRSFNTQTGVSNNSFGVSNKQPITTLNQPKTTENNRNSFKNDDDYEFYLLDTRTDLTKGDARDYIKQKASENNMTSMAYMQGMRNRYKNRSDTSKVREGINNGKYGEETLADINNRFGVMLDENGNEADAQKFQNDVDLVNRTATDIKSNLDKNEKNYQNGKIDYNTYVNENNRLMAMWNENASMGEKLNSYKALQGFDYYDWARDNGRDVRDFEAYVENVNDNVVERLATEWMASWVDTANIVPSTIEVLAQVINPEADVESKGISSKLRETSNELKEYAFAGASPVSQWSLTCIGSLMPMINSMLVGSTLGLAGKGVEAFTNITLGMQSGAETTRQRLEEGNSSGVSLMNGILHGTITGLVEAFNMGQISELVTGAPTKYLATLGLAQYANPKAIAQYLLSAGVGEGTEEVIETIADYIADQTQNWIVGGINGDRVNATELNVGDMANEFIMAFAGTVLMGAPSAVNISINTKAKYNGAMQARAHFESVINSELSLPEEKELARKSIEVIDYVTQPYINTSMLSDAVQLQSDMVNPAMTYDEMMNNLANAINPDIKDQLASAEQTLRKSYELKNSLQESLMERGINMPAEDFVNMTQKERTEFLSLGKFFNENGLESGFGNIGNGQNGLNVENGVLLNTNQTRTLDIDSLADLNDSKYKSLNIRSNDIFKEAGADASATTATAHEITHFAQRSGRWNDLRNLAVEMMGESRFNKAVARLEDIYKARGDNNVNAEQEAVAFFIQKNLGNQEFLTRLTNYNSSFFNRLLTNVKSLFSTEASQQLEQTFMKAFLDSKRAFDVSAKNGSVAPAMASSIGSWEKTDVDALEQAIMDELNSSKTLGSEDVTLEEVHKWVESVNSVSKMIADDIERLGFVSNVTYSAMKKNSDYRFTIDMSTLCKKRLLLQGTIDAVQRAMPNTPLTSMDYIIIRDMMAKKGLEVSCGFCYVESARRLLGKVAEEFIQTTGADVTIADLVTVDGVENLQQTNPEVYNDFVKFNNARGQQRAMLVQTRTEYRGEIRKLTERAVADLIRRGGLRLQSYSDFETPHLIDMMQVVLDMASRGLTSQAYTKVPNFADAFGNTNIKINLSLVCKGVDENGELIFDDVEGMPHEEAFRLRDKYSKNVGTILVGKDDATILSAMADPRIDYIIPFHRSGWANAEFELLGIKGYENYTEEQHEKFLASRQYEITQGKNKGKLSKPTRKPKGGDILPLSFWDFNKSGRENAVTYLELCRQDKRIPKFSRFLEHHGTQKLDADGNPMFVESGKNKGQPIWEEEWWSLQPDGSTDGYWKTLIDFKMYDNDGVGSPQQKVVPIFDDEVNQRILNEYQGGHRTLRSAEDVVQQFLDSKNGKGQYSLGYNPENPYDDYDADGNEIPENLSKRMVGSKLTNGLGQLLPLYHTSGALFNEFDPTGSEHYRYGNQTVIFLSSNKRVSGSYAEDSRYDEIENEEDFLKKKERLSRVTELRKEYEMLERERDTSYDTFRENIAKKLNNLDVKEDLNDIYNKLVFQPDGEYSNYIRTSMQDFLKASISSADSDSIYSLKMIESAVDMFNNLNMMLESEFFPAKYKKFDQRVLDALSGLSSVEEKVQILLGEIKTAEEIYESYTNKIDEAKRRFIEEENRQKEKRGNQYVGYGKAVNPYILQGGVDENGRYVNWNSINNSDFAFKESDLDSEDLIDSLLELSKNYYKYFTMLGKDHKQARAEKLLELLGEKNREYMLKNPIVLANLATLFDRYNTWDLDNGSDVYDYLQEHLNQEIGGEEWGERFDEVYDLAKEIANKKGYKVFNDEEWDEAVKQLGISPFIKFTNGLETNDVVKAVLAINDFIKNNSLEYEPYDGVVFKNITDSGNGDAWDVMSDIIALFNSNQFKSVGNWNPTDSGNIFHSFGETSESAKKAIDEFGTTDDFNKAGYILGDGSLLDLSEGQDRRTQDHRSVGYIYDDIDYARDGMSAGLIRFMNEGNVRILPESGSIDISRLAEPTNAQYRQIANFLRNYRDEWVTLDISYEDGAKVFSMAYPPFTSASTVVNDIKNYFADGTIPEMESDDLYQYSRGEVDEGLQANQEAVERNGAFDYGMNPAREADIAKETDYGKTMQTVRTIANSMHIDDDMAKRMQSKTGLGKFAKEVQPDDKVIEKAKKFIRENGFVNSYEHFLKAKDVYNVNRDFTIGVLLLDEMEATGLYGTEEYDAIADKCVSLGNALGLGLRSVSFFKRMSPQGQITTIQSEIERLQRELNQRWGDRARELVVPDYLFKDYVDQNTSEERRQQIREEIAQLIADQIPPTFLEQLNSWRHMAMLFNPRTWIKNRASNFFFGYISEITRAIRSGLESWAVEYGKTHEKSIFHNMEREAGAYNMLSEADRTMYRRFAEDYNKSFKENISKYSNMDIGGFLSDSDFGKLVQDKRKSFSWEFLNKLDEINRGEGKGWLKHLGLSDAPAMRKAYAKSMVGYFKANKLNPDTATAEQMKKARDFAFKEALYTTFNTNNWLANQITKFEKNADKAGHGTVARMFVESFIPFKRTPLNLIKTGYNYTTVGLVTNLVRDLNLVKKGEMTANQLINHLAQGLTGSGLIALGMLLHNMGLFRTKDDDKDRKKYFDQDNGEQDYSLVFDDFTYKIDWLDPMIVPMAIGAELNKVREEGNFSMETIGNVVSSIADPMFETSMLSGITKNLTTYEKSPMKQAGQVLRNTITNYLSQYVPSLGGALTRTFDPYRRTTYPNNGSLDQFGREVRGKLGFSYLNEPYVNRNGNPERAEDLGLDVIGRGILNLLSPGYYKSRDIDEHDEELYRLYNDTGSLDVLPSNTSKDTTFNKETMKFSPEEYTEWHEVRWQTETKYVNQFLDSSAYQGMSDDERVATIKKIREYAQMVAKKDFLESKGYEYTDNKELADEYPDKYVYDKQYNSTTGALDAGIDLYQYFDYKNNAGTKQAEKAEYLANSGMSQEQIDYLWGLEGYKKAYQSVLGGKSSSKKKSSGGSKKASKKKVSSKSISKGGSTSYNIKQSKVPSISGAKGIDSNFLKSYVNTFNRSGGKASTGSGNTIVCPKCGNRVPAGTNVCPICGTRLG